MSPNPKDSGACGSLVEFRYLHLYELAHGNTPDKTIMLAKLDSTHGFLIVGIISFDKLNTASSSPSYSTYDNK